MTLQDVLNKDEIIVWDLDSLELLHIFVLLGHFYVIDNISGLTDYMSLAHLFGVLHIVMMRLLQIIYYIIFLL